MHEDHFGRDVRQIEGLLDRGISPADHGDLLVAIEKTVAGGAGRDPAAAEGFLRGQAEIHGARARGDDECIAGVDGRVAGQLEGARLQIDCVDVVEDDLGLEALGVAPHPLHQVRSLNAVGVPRPVVHVRRRHQLAALLQTCDQDRAQVGACGVNGRRVAGWAGSQDQEPAVLGFAHISILQLNRARCGMYHVSEWLGRASSDDCRSWRGLSRKKDEIQTASHRDRGHLQSQTQHENDAFRSRRG